MRFAVVLLVVLSAFAGGSALRPALAQGDACEEVPPGLVARIETGMKYFDVWLHATRAVRTYEFGVVAWIVSADMGGPEYDGNTDMAHWLVTSLDPTLAEIFKIDKGHADYLSDLPDAGNAGFDVGYLSEGLGDAQECATDAAKETGGLGIDRDTWEDRHGKTKDTRDGFATRDGAIEFRLEEDRIAAITWTLDEPRPVEEARVLTRDLIPDDAVLAGTSAEAPRRITDQPDAYASEWLQDRFDEEDVWGGADPGSFAATFSLDASGLVESFSLELGEP